MMIIIYGIVTVYCVCSRQLTHFECPVVIYVTLISVVSLQFICTLRFKVGYCSCHCLCITYWNAITVANTNPEVRSSGRVHSVSFLPSARPKL